MIATRTPAVLAALLAVLASGCANSAVVLAQPLSIESLCEDRLGDNSSGRHHPVLGRFVDDRISGDGSGPIVDVTAVQNASASLSARSGSKAQIPTKVVRTYIRTHGGGILAYWADLRLGGAHGAAIDGTAFADGDMSGKGHASFVRMRGAGMWQTAVATDTRERVCD
jgi:hypothetical protein